ncbi:MAG TPA: hypothetical protein VLO09_02640 [Ornithinimicrobium sp.]|nr:hypothetical protein [Ornithinimicrobium sp.]
MSGDLEHQRAEAREELSPQGAGMGMDEEPTTFEPEEDPDAVEDDDPDRVLPDEERAVGDAETEDERLLPDGERRVPDLAPDLDAPD